MKQQTNFLTNCKIFCNKITTIYDKMLSTLNFYNIINNDFNNGMDDEFDKLAVSFDMVLVSMLEE